MGLESQKTFLFSVPVILLAVILHFADAMFADGIMGGLITGAITAVVFAITAVVLSAIVALLTKAKEGFLVYGMAAFAVLVLANLVVKYIQPFYQPLLNALGL